MKKWGNVFKQLLKNFCIFNVLSFSKWTNMILEPDNNKLVLWHHSRNMILSNIAIIFSIINIDRQQSMYLIEAWQILRQTRAMLVAKQRVGLPFDLSSIYSIR